MRRLVLVLLLLSFVGCGMLPAFAQQKKPVWLLPNGRPGDEGTECNAGRWPDAYIAGTNDVTNLGNVYVCNRSDDEWDTIAPSSASDRTGWYILSDDLNSADELATQIGFEATGTGSFVRADSPVLNLADIQFGTVARGPGTAEGAATWIDSLDRLQVGTGTGTVVFFPGSHLTFNGDVNQVAFGDGIGGLTAESAFSYNAAANTLTFDSWSSPGGQHTSSSANTAIGWDWDTSVARTTGDIAEWSDNGAWKFRINSVGNLQLRSGGRIFLAYGSDEGAYNDTWGQVVIRRTATETSGTYANNMRLNTNITLTSGTPGHRALWVTAQYQPSGAATGGVNIEGAFYEVSDESSNAGSILTMYGQRNLVQALVSGATTIGEMFGSGAYLGFPGTNKDIGYAAGIRVHTSGSMGSGTTLDYFDGVRIENLRGYGDNRNAAIYVYAQSGDDGSEGNIEMGGDGYEEGHFVSGQYHFGGWNGGAGGFWVEENPPTSDTDGICVAHCETANKATEAKLCYSTGSFDTGTECCAEFGMTCDQAHLVSSMETPRACSYDVNPINDTWFFASCY